MVVVQRVRCPWCGASATVRGNMWECGFCGDSGFLRADQLPKVTISLTVEQDEPDPEETERGTVHPAPPTAPAAQTVKPAPVDDGRTYRFCQLRFGGVSRTYSYLTEDETIQPGDWVLAPFGQRERTGEVERVDICSAANAPYPPERTKHIIGKTDAPDKPEA